MGRLIDKKKMKTKIVYTLVSDAADTYLEQALLSVYSLRLYNPHIVVSLVVDQETGKTISGGRAEIKKYVTDIVEVEVPLEYSKVQKSRYLKTNLRKLIRGDYLFIDCDTIICGSLEDIDKIDVEIGMVADVNGDLALSDVKVLQRYKDAGFGDATGLPYFNSGVIYAKDTNQVHQFYEDWYTNWCRSDSNGVKYDQPALCATNVKHGFLIKEISGVWNCQFKYHNGYKLLDDALILHYYANNGQGKRPHSQDRIFEYIKEKGEIDHVVAKLVRHPKTTLYTVMTINDDKAFEYFNSDMIYTYFNVPKAYRIACGVARMLEQPWGYISKHFKKH